VVVTQRLLLDAIRMLQLDRASLRAWLEERDNPCLELLEDTYLDEPELRVHAKRVEVAPPLPILVHPERGDDAEAREATWVVRSVEKRQDALHTVLTAVLEAETPTIASVSERAGFHRSTVERVVHGKDVELDGDVVPFASLLKGA